MYKKCRLSDTLSTYSGRHFPYTKKHVSHHRYEAVIGIGGNIGDVRRRFEHLFFKLQKEKLVDIVRTSLILKNPPFGYTQQDDFFNSIIVLKTSMQAKKLLEYLLRLEKKFARKRSFKDAPRTLDLDIIFFNHQVLQTEKLTLPHAKWHERESVLIPLIGLVA